MTSSMALSVTTFIYGLAAFLYVFSWVFGKTLPGTLANRIAILGLAGNSVGIVLRWVESYQLGIGHAPLSNLYESLVFFSWVIIFLYQFVERKYENLTIGTFAVPLAFLVMAYASFSTSVNSAIQPLVPALKSNWLITHVVTCFIGYAAFAIAFGISVIYLFKQRDNEATHSLLGHFPDLSVLDELTHQMVMFGFLFLSIGIITGAVWANSAWGRYWGWDPKETWSLITWFIYATLLHARMMRGWHGRRIALLSIIGFAAVLFTYFGVNYLPGLHSYGAMGQ
jgi:cytochrome c-type biogenesis protein CcsB